MHHPHAPKRTRHRNKKSAQHGLGSLALRRIVKVLVVAVIALSGWAFITSGRAATYSAPAEAEVATRAGKTAMCSDRTASAGAAIRFGHPMCALSGQTYTNPVKSGAADPGVFEYQGKYYMVTTYSGTQWFAIYVSNDLVNWQVSGKSVFYGSTHPWGRDRFWAPEITQLADGRFAVYYTAGDSGGRLRIGVALANDILGPYTDLGRPLISDSSFSVIDAHYFRDDNGKQYLFWKEDSGNTRIFGQELTANGIGFVGSRATVLQKGLAWEGSKGIEGPWVTKRGGQYFMYYSGGLFSAPDYGVGVARSSTPLGSYVKRGDPILRTGNRWKGPGHNSIVRVGINDYMVYHAWDRSPGVGERWGMVDKITWVNGWPTIAGGVPTESQQPVPY